LFRLLLNWLLFYRCHLRLFSWHSLLRCRHVTGSVCGAGTVCSTGAGFSSLITVPVDLFADR